MLKVLSGAQVVARTGAPQKHIPEGLSVCVRDIAKETGRLVVMHSGSPWNATGGGQRPQQLAECLSRHAAVVHLSYGNPGTPIMVPSGPTVRKLAEAKQWVNNVSADHSIFYSSFPDANSLDVIDALGPHWFVIYDCVDLWNDFPNAKWYSLDLEKSIAQRANLVTCTSFALRDHCEALRKRQCDTAVKVLNNSTRIVGQPWVGERNVDFVYVGWIQDDWLDWDVVRDLADRGHSVRVLGPVQGEPPFTHRHVDWMGEIPGSSLMRYLSECKVGLIPFRDSPLVHAVDPIKSYDYAAAGLPVVASGFPELQDASHCFSVHREDFVAAAEDALIASWDREAIATYAEAHTAARRAEELTRWLDEEGAW